jgi:hypothetical protein
MVSFSAYLIIKNHAKKDFVEIAHFLISFVNKFSAFPESIQPDRSKH